MSQHVIFGTGALGQALAAGLLRRGETGIRMVNRGVPRPAGRRARRRAGCGGAAGVDGERLPDIGEGLAVLGAHPAAAGRVWHLPNDPSAATTRELVDLARRVAGTGPGTVRATPWPLLRLVALRDRTVRELLEMRYEFDEPFLVDSSRIARELGVTATPHAEAIAATLAAHRAAGRHVPV